MNPEGGSKKKRRFRIRTFLIWTAVFALWMSRTQFGYLGMFGHSFGFTTDLWIVRIWGQANIVTESQSYGRSYCIISVEGMGGPPFGPIRPL